MYIIYILLICSIMKIGIELELSQDNQNIVQQELLSGFI